MIQKENRLVVADNTGARVAGIHVVGGTTAVTPVLVTFVATVKTATPGFCSEERNHQGCYRAHC